MLSSFFQKKKKKKEKKENYHLLVYAHCLYTDKWPNSRYSFNN